VYRKDGTPDFVAEGRIFWRGFGGKCESNNDGDPIVIYDKLSARWVLTQFVEAGGAPFLQCIAVSQTDDPGGQYYRYAFQFDEFDDYPKFGVWPDGYYASFNMFKDEKLDSPFLGGKICAFEREQMLAGKPARMVCFRLDNPKQGGFLPTDLDGTVPPPPNSPNYVLNLGPNRLNVWAFQVNWSDPTKSQFTSLPSVDVDPFVPTCPTSKNRSCIPQKDSPALLDSLADRLMYRLAYRNFGSHQAWVVNHDIALPDLGLASAVRWYELTLKNNSLGVVKQNTYAPDKSSRWMGSIAMDKVGNTLIGYNVSASTTFPSIAIAGRASDSTEFSIEKVIVPGGGYQSATRWGDYSSMTVDPSDDCTFWYTAEYQPSNGTYNWSTHVGHFKFEHCQ
jgi:hypothetical protein